MVELEIAKLKEQLALAAGRQIVLYQAVLTIIKMLDDSSEDGETATLTVLGELRTLVGYKEGRVRNSPEYSDLHESSVLAGMFDGLDQLENGEPSV